MILIHNLDLHDYHTKNYERGKVCSRNKTPQLNLKKNLKSPHGKLFGHWILNSFSNLRGKRNHSITGEFVSSDRITALPTHHLTSHKLWQSLEEQKAPWLERIPDSDPKRLLVELAIVPAN